MRKLSISLSLAFGSLCLPALAAGRAQHVVVMVWDGMRPDFINASNTPVLYDLSQHGVFFQNHHAVYVSTTEVNGTALATGSYPGHDGIVGNKEYRPEIDPLNLIHTEETSSVRKGDDVSGRQYLSMATLPEIVRGDGRRTAVAGAKAVALLWDRAERTNSDHGAVVYAGETLPEGLAAALTNRYGVFPAEAAANPSRNDWTTLALVDSLWADGVPAFSVLWMSQPDHSQHQTGPGSAQSLAAIRSDDANLARVIRALDAKRARDTTDIFVVSDHGFSTVYAKVNLADALREAGLKAYSSFKEKPVRGDVLVIGNSGSAYVYVIDHDDEVIRKAVDFLQGWKYSGVIFTRKAMPGTFALEDAGVAGPHAPDVLVSLRWSPDVNAAGTPGMIISDSGDYEPGHGTHGSLSHYDMHNTLVAAGPDFRSGVSDVLPTGNVDIAPTALWILGIKPPKEMDGRILTEALAIPGPKLKSYEPERLEAAREMTLADWHQYLEYSEVNGVRYLDEGNGWQLPK